MIGRRIFRRTAAVLLIVLVLPIAALGQTTRLTFLHANDTYEIVPTRGWGGFAPLMTVLKEQRAASAHSLTTFGGDLLSPSIMSGLHRGAQMIELMNAVGTDIAVLGNHEFDFGPDVLRQRMGESRFPWLATNVKRNGAVLEGATDTVIRELGGVKVGFFGLVTPETTRMSSPGPTVAFGPYREAAVAAVRVLRDFGAEIVVALTHLNFAEDREVARTVPGIALILGGHDHDAMTMLEGNTLILKSGADARYLGVVDLTVVRRTPPSGPPTVDVTHAWRMIPVRGIAPDPEIASLVKRHTDRLDGELSVEIGTATRPLDSRQLAVREGEAAIGNLFADAIRGAVGAEAALLNGGGIRGNRTYEAGTRLTRRDILTELPFGNSAGSASGRVASPRYPACASLTTPPVRRCIASSKPASTASRSTRRASIAWRPSISWSAAATVTPPWREVAAWSTPAAASSPQPRSSPTSPRAKPWTARSRVASRCVAEGGCSLRMGSRNYAQPSGVFPTDTNSPHPEEAAKRPSRRVGNAHMPVAHASRRSLCSLLSMRSL